MNPQQENELNQATGPEQELAEPVAGSATRITDAELVANAQRLEVAGR